MRKTIILIAIIAILLLTVSVAKSQAKSFLDPKILELWGQTD